MKLLAIALIGSVFLAGCSSAPPRQIEISAKPIDKPQLILPPVNELRLKETSWIIITEENAEEVFAELLKDKKDPVLIGLTDEGYETLALNLSDIMALLQQQKAIIAAYQNYYENAEQALEDANSQIEGAQAEVDAQQTIKEESTLDRLNPFN